jgi:hypothetical protein
MLILNLIIFLYFFFTQFKIARIPGELKLQSSHLGIKLKFVNLIMGKLYFFIEMETNYM